MVEHSSSKTEIAAECLQMISFLRQKLLSAIKSAHVLVSAHHPILLTEWTVYAYLMDRERE